ncbi:MAG: hypothetical protein ABGZ49_13590 [Akkermansiaceae bacterium]
MRLCLPILGVLLVLGIVLASGSGGKTPNRSEPKFDSPTIANVAAGYQSFRKMTKKPMLVDPGFFTACRKSRKEMLARARKKSAPPTQSITPVHMNENAVRAFEWKHILSSGFGIVKQKAPVDSGKRKQPTWSLVLGTFPQANDLTCCPI